MIILRHNINGTYKSLQNLLLIDKFGHNAIYTYCTSIMARKFKKMCATSVNPSIRMQKIPETALGVHVGPDKISWALINCNFKVLHWDWKNYSLDYKSSIYDFIRVVISVINKIPNSSIYVAEELRFKNVKHTRLLNIQQQLLLSIIACLTLRDGQNNTNNIYILKPQTSGEIFQLMIGGENICTKYIMNITTTDSVIRFNKTTSIDMQIGSDMKKKYMQETNAQQEQMRLSLLNTMSFLILVAYQNNLDIPNQKKLH